MIPGCTVVELRADRTPGEQAQGAYTRVLAQQGAEGAPRDLAVAVARECARLVARDARRNATEHTRQGLVTERFVDQPPDPRFEPVLDVA